MYQLPMMNASNHCKHVLIKLKEKNKKQVNMGTANPCVHLSKECPAESDQQSSGCGWADLLKTEDPPQVDLSPE